MPTMCFILLLLACTLAGTLASECPTGTVPVDAKNMAKAKEMGTQVFRSRPRQACAKYPLFIEDAGLKKWLVGEL